MAERISTNAVLSPDTVAEVKAKTERIKVKTAAWIVAAVLFIGVVFLFVGIFYQDDELKTWATGLISLVTGSSLGFVFGRSGADA